MTLIIHIIIAIVSLVYATFLFFYPSRSRLYTSYGLVGLTLASGTYLVVSSHAPVMPSCVSGLTYLGVIAVAILSARHKLASVSVRS